MINSKKLIYFVAVAEEQHFGRAATRLGISQPPLSEHIQHLESDLGVKLFARNTRSVRLTREGEALLTHARKIIGDIDKCHAVVHADGNRSRKTVNLGILHAHAYSFLPDFLRAYCKANPEVAIQLVEYTTNEQIARLMEETIDVGIVREPVVHPGIVVENLFHEAYMLAVPQDWLREGVTHSSIRDFAQATMISYPSHDSVKSTNRVFTDYLRQHDVAIKNRIEMKTMHSALALVAAEKGFSPVPRSLRKLKFPYVAYLEIQEEPPTLSVGIAWREQFLELHVRDFVTFAKAYFAKAADIT